MAGGGSKEPNLTPLIDLFSVLIVFLLISAAFTQLDSIGISVDDKVEGESAIAENPSPPKEEDPNKIKPRVRVRKNDFELILRPTEIPRRWPLTPNYDPLPEDFSMALKNLRLQVKESDPIILEFEDEAKYKDAIRMYDFLMKNDWALISVNPF